MNSFNVSGNLVKSIDLKEVSGGLALAKGAVAENVFKKGEKSTYFWDFTAFGKTAERMAQACNKGDGVVLVGSFGYNEVVSDKTGQKVRYYDLKVDNFDITRRSEKNGGGESTPATKTTKKTTKKTKTEEPVEEAIEEDDIPF